jgi:hypothetical protein
MANSFLIDRDTICDEGAISLAPDIPLNTLDRARPEGRLRFTRKGRRVFFRGQWLLDWFEADRNSHEANP